MRPLDRWAIRRARQLGEPLAFTVTAQEKAIAYAAEHGGIERYCKRQDGSLVLTDDGYPVPKSVDPDWSTYWGGGVWS